MNRPDWEYLKGCFSLTREERQVVVVAMAVLALGAAVKCWRESQAKPVPVRNVASQSVK